MQRPNAVRRRLRGIDARCLHQRAALTLSAPGIRRDGQSQRLLPHTEVMRDERNRRQTGLQRSSETIDVVNLQFNDAFNGRNVTHHG
jgi:hypothetical protein